MKNLLVMRHAKSDWGNSALSDFDRPLNERGVKSAPLMGKELLKRNKIPELIVTSPANRAKTTAEMTSEACSYKNQIIHEKEFYFGSMDEIIRIIKNFDNSYDRIMIVGHNPTSESLIYKLLKENIPVEMPTAAIASLLFDTDSWQNIGLKTARLDFHISPKQLL